MTFARRGDYKKAYEELYEYKTVQDKTLARILHNDVAQSLNQYGKTRAKLEDANSKIRNLVFYLILTTIILVSVISAWILNERVRRKEKERRDTEIELDRTEKVLAREIESNMAMSESLANVMRDRYEPINKTCDGINVWKNKNNGNKEADPEVKRIIDKFNDAEYLKQTALNIDKYSNGIYSSFISEFPHIKEDGKKLFLYLCLGFSPRTIAVISRQEIEVIYNRKSRLKKAIKDSGSPMIADFLNAIR